VALGATEVHHFLFELYDSSVQLNVGRTMRSLATTVTGIVKHTCRRLKVQAVVLRLVDSIPLLIPLKSAHRMHNVVTKKI
jgi:hypothetical protein